jgi:hypothetical protein
MKWLIVVALIGLGCSGKPASEPVARPGSGSAAGAAGGAAQVNPACAAVRPRVEQLYRAEAQAREPGRVDEAVTDNTTMVMNDCGKAPDKVAACVTSASTVKDLEARCLAPIDDEGTEGDQRAR